MELILNNTTYQSKRIVGSVYDSYCEKMDYITKTQEEEKRGWNKDDMEIMREFLVEYYNNQFTATDLYEQLSVDELIVQFMGVQVEIEKNINSRLEVLAKK